MRSQSLHYSFGMLIKERSYSSPAYRYGFNGKEKNDEINVDGGDYDFGARIYDSRLGRWLSLDAYSAYYPSFSTFMFALNTPIVAIDADGKKVYFVIYTGGTADGEAAAETREAEIKSMPGYDDKKDHVYYLTITDLGKLEEEVKNCVEDANKNGYGKTVEVSFYGHCAGDGPVGSDYTSKNNLSDCTGDKDPFVGDVKQLSPDGWKNVQFNFDPNGSVIAFYGCNSYSFAEKYFSYDQNVKYTVGLDGGAGGSFTPKGDFSETPIGINFGKPVYFVTTTDPKDIGEKGPIHVDPRNVFQRGINTIPETTQHDCSLSDYDERKPSFKIYGNVTVDGGGHPCSNVNDTPGASGGGGDSW